MIGYKGLDLVNNVYYINVEYNRENVKNMKLLQFGYIIIILLKLDLFDFQFLLIINSIND